MTRWLCSWLFVALLAVPAYAQEAEDGKADKEKDKKEQKEPELVRTQHKASVGGKEIAYTATAGLMPLKEDGTKKLADIFFVAYTKDGAEAAERPITFCFNGGPGSSSVWLHLGAFGPRKVKMGDEGEPLPPPYRLEDNPHSLLDLTDLVFVDPVSTGYSRPAEGEKKSQFHGVEEDVASVGEFIRSYLTRFERWPSAKFLAGESYGTTRAAGLALALQSEMGINLNGILLVSSVLNFQTVRYALGNDLPYIVFLPSFTATAWYHNKLPADLQQDFDAAVKESREFAAGEYATALLKGDTLQGNERRKILEKLVRLTGLEADTVDDANLRVGMSLFAKDLLRDDERTIGRFDSRYQGRDRTNSGDRYDYDPSYAAIQGLYTATLNGYLRSELEYKTDVPYEILTGNVQPWSYRSATGQYLNLTDDLRQAITQNPALKVMVANGYYDLATPFFATEYTFNHLGLSPEYADNVRMAYYKAGHMMYVRKESLAKFKEDVAEFYRDALNPGDDAVTAK